MSDKYKITEKEKAYFVTLTVVGWIDVFIVMHSLQTSASRGYSMMSNVRNFMSNIKCLVKI